MVIYFVFTFLETFQVSSVKEVRLISAVSRSDCFLLLLLHIISVGTFFSFLIESGMTRKVNDRVFYPIISTEVVKEC